MGKTNQEQIRRKLAQAFLKCTRAMGDLGYVEAKFAGTHDELAEFLRVIIVSLDVTCDCISEFCMRAWGRIPDDWETWRNAAKVGGDEPDAPTND